MEEGRKGREGRCGKDFLRYWVPVSTSIPQPSLLLPLYVQSPFPLFGMLELSISRTFAPWSDSFIYQSENAMDLSL